MNRPFGTGLSTVLNPDMIKTSLTCSTQLVWLLNACSLECQWQTYLPSATADNTSLLNQAHVQYQRSTGGSTVEKPAETQTSIRLDSHLVREPSNSRSGGHEFESHVWWDSVHWLKEERPLGQVFHCSWASLARAGGTDRPSQHKSHLSGHSTIARLIYIFIDSP